MEEEKVLNEEDEIELPIEDNEGGEVTEEDL